MKESLLYQVFCFKGIRYIQFFLNLIFIRIQPRLFDLFAITNFSFYRLIIVISTVHNYGAEKIFQPFFVQNFTLLAECNYQLLSNKKHHLQFPS